MSPVHNDSYLEMLTYSVGALYNDRSVALFEEVENLVNFEYKLSRVDFISRDHKFNSTLSDK